MVVYELSDHLPWQSRTPPPRWRIATTSTNLRDDPSTTSATTTAAQLSPSKPCRGAAPFRPRCRGRVAGAAADEVDAVDKPPGTLARGHSKHRCPQRRRMLKWHRDQVVVARLDQQSITTTPGEPCPRGRLSGQWRRAAQQRHEALSHLHGGIYKSIKSRSQTHDRHVQRHEARLVDPASHETPPTVLALSWTRRLRHVVLSTPSSREHFPAPPRLTRLRRRFKQP